MIAEAWRADLHAYMGGTIRGLGGIPLAIGGVADHVHAVVGLKATVALADLVREVKKATSVWAMERFGGFSWQTGYAAFTVSPGDVDRVVAYVRRQEEHHRTLSSQDELRTLLDEFGVEYDERYFE